MMGNWRKALQVGRPHSFSPPRRRRRLGRGAAGRGPQGLVRGDRGQSVSEKACPRGEGTWLSAAAAARQDASSACYNDAALVSGFLLKASALQVRLPRCV